MGVSVSLEVDFIQRHRKDSQTSMTLSFLFVLLLVSKTWQMENKVKKSQASLLSIQSIMGREYFLVHRI